MVPIMTYYSMACTAALPKDLEGALNFYRYDRQRICDLAKKEYPEPLPLAKTRLRRIFNAVSSPIYAMKQALLRQDIAQRDLCRQAVDHNKIDNLVDIFVRNNLRFAVMRDAEERGYNEAQCATLGTGAFSGIVRYAELRFPQTKPLPEPVPAR